jgi:2-iminobutanoate/2-iminopropanoate deaminase
MRIIVTSKDVPAPVGPYSQAIKAGGFVFLAGQVPLEGGNPIAGGIAGQTERVLRNVHSLLEAAGSRMDKVVRCVVYLQNMDDFAAMNEVYAKHFPTRPPVRTTIQAARLPKGCLIEIEVTALE